jgi:hypothetical protein
MPIRVECPRCHDTAYFADNDAGLAIACLACGQHIRIAKPSEAAAPRPKLIEQPSPPPLFANTPAHLLNPPKPAAPPPPPAREARPRPKAIHPPTQRSRWRTYSILLLLFVVAGLVVLIVQMVRQRPEAPLAQNTPPQTQSAVASAPTPARTAQSSPQAPIQKAAPAMLASLPGAPRVSTYTPAGAPVGFVGLERIDCTGHILIDSYDASIAVYSPDNARDAAPLLSNGPIRLTGEGQIKGALHPGIGSAYKPSKRILVTGPTDPLAARLFAPAVSLDPLANDSANSELSMPFYQRGNLSITGRQTLHLPAGVYYLNDLLIEPSASLHLEGPVTMLIHGRLAIIGKLHTHENRPANCRIRLTSEKPVLIMNENRLHLDLYAPQSTVDINGKGDLFGAIVARSLRVGGDRPLHFDESLLPK